MSNHAELNAISDRLEAALAKHQIHCRVLGGRRNDFGLSLILQPADGVNPDRVFAARNIIRAAMRSNSISMAQNGAVIEVLDAKPYSGNAIWLSGLIDRYDTLPPYHAVAGLRDDGTPLAVNLASNATPHMLISGTTGSGKTVLAHTIITSLTALNKPHALNVVVLDPKGGDPRFLANISHHMPMPVAETPDEQHAALERVVQIMLDRKSGSAMPRIVVYIDEMADTALAGGKAALELLSRIAARGRSAGINIVGCTQNPSSKSLPEDLRRNLPLRFVGKVSNATEARMASGISDCGAEMLPGKGAFVCVVNGDIQRFQAAMPDIDIPNPCAIPSWPKRTAYTYHEPIAMPHAAPVQIVAPVTVPPIVESGGITQQAIIAAMLELKAAGTPITKTNVLTAMNRPAAGGSWRKIGELWADCIAIFEHLPTQNDLPTRLPTYLPTQNNQFLPVFAGR